MLYFIAIMVVYSKKTVRKETLSLNLKAKVLLHAKPIEI